MSDYITMLHKHKINGGFLAPDRIPMEERNKNEMILELQNEVHTKDKEIERLHIIIEESIKLTNKVNDMESARDLYDLIVDIKNKLKDSDKE